MEARGSVGGEAHPGFVAERVQRQDARALDDLEEGQREVAGDAEDLTRSSVPQRVEQCLSQLHQVPRVRS